MDMSSWKSALLSTGTALPYYLYCHDSHAEQHMKMILTLYCNALHMYIEVVVNFSPFSEMMMHAICICVQLSVIKLLNKLV